MMNTQVNAVAVRTWYENGWTFRAELRGNGVLYLTNRVKVDAPPIVDLMEEKWPKVPLLGS